MSVINQMLQDLEHRRSRPAGDGSLSAQVRAVPPRRQLHPAWWIAGGILMTVIGVLAWAQLRPDSAEATPVFVDATPIGVEPEAVVEVDTTGSLAPAPRMDSEPAPALRAAESMPESTAARAAPAGPARRAAGSPPTRSERLQLDEPRPEEAQLVAAEPQFDVVPVNKEITAQQRTDNEYAKAVAMAQAGQTAEAMVLLDNLLRLEPGNAQVRHTLIGLLVEGRNFSEAERRLQEGLKLDPAQIGLAVILARLQVERGAAPAALQTLQHSLPHASGQADYLAFLAALMQRQGRHREAIDYYLQALRTQPGSGVWLMGLGISLQADNRGEEARVALGRALASNTLSPDLRAYVEQQLGRPRR